MKNLLLSLSLCIVFQNSALAQRHLPDVQIFDTEENIYLDTVAETPPVNNGISVAAVPYRGENLSVQVFIPRAAGLLGFECAITFANSDSALTRAFQILSVTNWRQEPLKAISSTQTISYYDNRLLFSPLPASGLIATAVFTPRQQIQSPLPIQFQCSVTVVSMPPRRVWQMRGTQTLHWQ